ncbi:MAG: GNAT family N-acetyltransferase [Pyrinomonadaceae bacterium]|nr:GNAT family N-acetyltransferase [Pyrinomonadaceae bacterium]
MINIRTAAGEDLPDLLNFEQELIAYERRLDPTMKKDGEINYYDLPELIASEKSRVLIAEANGIAVGCGFARIEENKPKFIERRHGYIGLVYVKEEFRRRGIAENILETLFDWLKERDVWEAMLKVYNDNDAAIKAYEKIGFRTGLIEMKMSLRNGK